MKIDQGIVLSGYTTMRVGGSADFFVEVWSVKELIEALEFARKKGLPVFILGGGSNVIFSDEGWRGLVIRVLIQGIEIEQDSKDEVLLKIGAGEIWDNVVRWAVSRGYWGIENLSLIPGLAGAFAVQNVGAYGQDASQVIESATVYDLKTGAIIQLSNQECRFAYRTSIFNTTEKGRYIICAIALQLKKAGEPNLTYRDLREHLGKNNPSLIEVREAVIAIRTRKLPDPTTHFNTGSFFKNMIVDEKKISTAQLIDGVGLKGYQIGGAKISEKHALVIENTGDATTTDILKLAHHVQEAIKRAYGYVVEIEPVIVHNQEER